MEVYNKNARKSTQHYLEMDNSAYYSALVMAHARSLAGLFRQHNYSEALAKAEASMMIGFEYKDFDNPPVFDMEV